MMRSFLGLVNYLNRFSPHLAELSEPLRQICRQNMEFELTESVCIAFSKTKEEISRNITLPYFNPNGSTTLQTDASKKGLGAVHDDDMIIYGRNDQEHDEHLVNFLEVCRKNTLTLNPDKMQFRLPQVSFFGHQWSARGLSPDPKKIATVKCMELPQDVEMMRSFLGLVNYLNRFSLHLAELSEPLRQICRQNMEFELTESVCIAFSKTKEEISRNITLPYFNPNGSTTSAD